MKGRPAQPKPDGVVARCDDCGQDDGPFRDVESAETAGWARTRYGTKLGWRCLQCRARFPSALVRTKRSTWSDGSGRSRYLDWQRVELIGKRETA